MTRRKFTPDQVLKVQVIMEATQSSSAAARPGSSSASATYMARLLSLPHASQLNPAALQRPGQPGGPLIANWRPCGDAAGLPPALQHPAFGVFLDRARSGEIDQHDMGAAIELCYAASAYHTDAEALVREGTRILREYLDVQPHQEDLRPFARGQHGRHLQPPDWHIVDNGSDVTCVQLLMVARSGLRGGDPAFQGAGHYMEFFRTRISPDGEAVGGVSERLWELYDATCCPALLLEVLGPHLRVSSLAWFDRVVLCPLTPLLNTLWVQDDPQVDALARALRALKEGLGALRAFYQEVQVKGTRAQGTQGRAEAIERGLPYPLHTGYTDVTLLAGNRPLLFNAVRAADGKCVVVKCVPRYGADVHAAWAARGVAPQLYGTEALPGGYTRVEMEWLDPYDGWWMLHALQGTEDEAAAQAAAQAALATGHGDQAPFFVHGDARRSNCLVRRLGGREQGDGAEGGGGCGDGWEARFVDFDFAGVEGRDRYPAPLNPQLRWAEGAGYGRLLHRAHDTHLLRQPEPVHAA